MDKNLREGEEWEVGRESMKEIQSDVVLWEWGIFVFTIKKAMVVQNKKEKEEEEEEEEEELIMASNKNE